MKSRYTALVIAGALFVSACAEPTVPLPTLTRSQGMANVSGTQYILIAGGNLPSDLEASVAAAGGQLVNAMGTIGVAVATSSDPDFATKAGKISGIQSAVADYVLEFDTPRVTESVEAEPMTHGPTGVGSHETFRKMQWNVDAISAPAAWNAGFMGSGARVAVLDGGIHSAHIDLTGQIDAGRSASFVPGFAFNQDVGTFWHGTHVAGIIAAKDNGIGTVGVAPQATIIGVKVLHNGSGSFGAIIGGVEYASRASTEGGAGADIINMSLGAGFPKNAVGGPQLISALNRAMTYARNRGVSVIAALGNSGYDLDKTNNLVFVPAQSAHVLAVSATGPMGFALGATDFDRQASYTNFGQSAVNLAGPGGDFALPGNAPCSIARIPASAGSVNFPCWVFDMVVAPSRGAAASISSYSWAAGTSMASPAVAGVAALIKAANPTYGAAQIEAALRASADDLGKPGNDDTYGRGRVNAARAVGAQ